MALSESITPSASSWQYRRPVDRTSVEGASRKDIPSRVHPGLESPLSGPSQYMPQDMQRTRLSGSRSYPVYYGSTRPHTVFGLHDPRASGSLGSADEPLLCRRAQHTATHRVIQRIVLGFCCCFCRVLQEVGCLLPVERRSPRWQVSSASTAGCVRS